jgi:hypothetical protein
MARSQAKPATFIRPSAFATPPRVIDKVQSLQVFQLALALRLVNDKLILSGK